MLQFAVLGFIIQGTKY